MFSKILIANRGEIAVRIIRTAQRLGIRCVAVYSDCDRNALHVRTADEAIHIGANAAKDSYLCVDKIIDAAKRSGAEAIHPGYGFLSESPLLSEACAKNQLVFIGPPTPAIEAMGSKSAAKKIMGEANVPLVPGYHGDDQSGETLMREAEKIGYPILLKASAGGGGKGMREVLSGNEFDDALAGAKREANAAFGDDKMLIEKRIIAPRHVEVQVFCDSHGNGVFLGDRDCSLQRRHQKVIEEAPAPGLSDDLRQSMGIAAVRAAKAINYEGAGTVEFLLDQRGEFYFMEMNTRLQVEHPVTEMVTGVDLVEWQLRVAAGEALPLTQEQIKLTGHAFEARIYAEDPANNFLPQTGDVNVIQLPAANSGLRIDSGVTEGDAISAYYDPMIAKLIFWGEDRQNALRQFFQALNQYQIFGVTTNLPFLRRLASSADFCQEKFDTSYIDAHYGELTAPFDFPADKALTLAALYLTVQQTQAKNSDAADDIWSDNGNWRLNLPNRQHVDLILDNSEIAVYVEHLPTAGHFRITVNDTSSDAVGYMDGHELVAEVNGHKARFFVVETGTHLEIHGSEASCVVTIDHHERQSSEHELGGDAYRAPMNGTIVELLVEPGTQVEKGTPLLVMEAMKMEHTITAMEAGTVSAFNFKPGNLVEGGAMLLQFEAEETEE